jgi:hypothetical protein
MRTKLNERYGEDAGGKPFREGYDRGQHYLSTVAGNYRGRDTENRASEATSKRAA